MPILTATPLHPPGFAFPTGAVPTPKHQLLAAAPFVPKLAGPAQVAYVPKKLSYWCNDVSGTCVTTESAFAKACYHIQNGGSEIFITEAEVRRWAIEHGVWNGADLGQVSDWMFAKGFRGDGTQLYNEGRKLGVDYSSEPTLQSAIAQGPVKIAIQAAALASGAGSEQGWYSVGNKNRHRTDHCVSLCGYGAAAWLYSQLDVPLPSGLPGSTLGYLLFTWSTIGFVDHAWIMGTTDEAWLRDPTTIGVPPLAPPVPPQPPIPPGPTPVPGLRPESVLMSDGSRYLCVPTM